MADIEYENPVYEDDDEIVDDANVENILSTDTVFDPARVAETHAETGFGQRHVEREEYGDEIAEIAKSQEAREKDAFINKLETYFNQKLNGDRVYLKEKIYKKNGAWFFRTASKNDLQLTYIKEIKSSGKKAGDIKNLEILRSYNNVGVAELEKIFETMGTPVIPRETGLRQNQVAQRNLGLELRQAATAGHAAENIELETIRRVNEAETGYTESNFSATTESVVRRRVTDYNEITVFPEDQQRIYEALRDVDIVEFAQEPRTTIDMQLHNAKKLKFKLKGAEADLKSAKKHEDPKWIKDAEKEIYSIKLHLKVIADKLARLYLNKFKDSSLPLKIRLSYLFKLKGFKFWIIVTAVGVTISAIIAGITGTLSSAGAALVGGGKALGGVAWSAAAEGIKKAAPVVYSLFEKVRAGIWKIVLWAIGIVANIVKVIVGYLAKYIIILLAVVALVILQKLRKQK